MKTVGAGSLALLAGCLGSVAGPTEADNDPHDDHGGDNANSTEALPLAAPPTIIDLADQGFASTLRTVDARHEVVTSDANGGSVELPLVWAFAADDHDPSVPGPIYRVPEGETVELEYANDHDHDHTLHIHAVTKSWQDDGAPETSGHNHISPGDSHTYTIEADVPGTHFYHCHVQTDTHLDMGMYGIFRVDPADAEPVDREYFLTLRDWDSRLHRQYAGEDVTYQPQDRNSDTYTINGRSAPSTFHPELGSPLIVREDETVRVHLLNAGYEAHPFHTHRHRFTVVERDGSPIPEAARYEQDVLNIAPAERYTIEFEASAEPGIYPAHCHKVHHVTTEGRYPGGMATAIVYESAMDTDEFASVMDTAGFEG